MAYELHLGKGVIENTCRQNNNIHFVRIHAKVTTYIKHIKHAEGLSVREQGVTHGNKM